METEYNLKLTGIKHLDVDILNKLSDVDFVAVCKINKYYRNLCNSPQNDTDLWMNRVFTKFPYVPKHEHIKQKGNRTWSQYYIKDLSKFNRSIKRPWQELYDTSREGKLSSVMIVFKLFKEEINKQYIINGALENASRYGHLDIVKFLVKNGANVLANSNAAILFALRNRHFDVVKFLEDNGAEYNESDYDSWTSNGSYYGMSDYDNSMGSSELEWPDD